MKVGDKYLCKKSQSFNYYTIIENNYYTIDYLDNIWISVCIDGERGITFTLYSDFGYGSYFYNYFYTKQEERKFKLEKLCSNQEIK